MSNDHNPTPVGDEALGWPGQNTQADADQSSMDNTRPTSPVSGAARTAAARAAYAEADKSVPHTGDDLHVDQAPPVEEEPVVTDADPEDTLGDSVPNTPEELFNSAGTSADAQLAAERLADYQRLNAEYINYKRRMDRERAEDRTRTQASVVESLLPVLDEIHLARQHGELTEGSPFANIAAKLEAILGKYGVTSFGAVGDTFDPMFHEALMHTTAELPEGTTETTVVMVMQPGFQIGDRVIRPARVSVADPA